MKVLETIKKMLFNEDSISQEIAAEKMEEQIEKLKDEYEGLVNLQTEFKNDPKLILSREFAKTEKYIELMDHIKYKNINLIKEHEYWGMKYNILVELYNKLQEYISKLNGEILLDFNIDKYKQPVAIISPYNDGLHKIVLIKNTFHQEDYISYKVKDSNILITDICSKEPNVLHGTFMINMLEETAKHLKFKELPNLERIIVSDELINKLEKYNGILFFQKLGFESDSGNLTKKF